jgi:hypothetical protein
MRIDLRTHEICLDGGLVCRALGDALRGLFGVAVQSNGGWLTCAALLRRTT